MLYYNYMETVFNSRDLSLQEYSKKFEYFKEKFKIFEDLKKFQKIGKIPLSQKENEKKREIEETLEKKNEDMENNKKNTSRIEVGEPKTDNENKKKTKMIEEIQEEDEDNNEKVDEENMYNSEDSENNSEHDDNESEHDDNEDEDGKVNDTISDEENNKDDDVKVYCVYEAGFTQKLSRWWWSENREKTFKYLDDDFNEFVEFLDNIKLYTTSINYIYFSKFIKEICLYCNKIIPGLYNLKETYENISKIKAKIDSIIMILIDFKAEMAVLRKRQKAIYSKVKRF